MEKKEPTTGLLKALEEHLQCPICLEVWDDPVGLQCGHAFCRKCLLRLPTPSSGRVCCPVCRSTEERGVASIQSSFHLASVVEALNAHQRQIQRNEEIEEEAEGKEKANKPQDLKPGDHVYVFVSMGMFTRHGIYVGDGDVIHFPDTKDSHTIVRTSLQEFSEGRTIRVAQYGESFLSHFKLRGTSYPQPSKPVEEVVQAALAAVGTDFGTYDFVKSNSEHFATMCKTGTKRSLQASLFGALWANEQK